MKIYNKKLEKAINFDHSIIQIPIQVNKDLSETELELLKKVHYRRLDANDLLIRSSSRVTDKVIKPHNTIARKMFSVTIDNSLYKRYQGEVAIILKDLPMNEAVNVVGRVIATPQLLDAIKPGDKFKFIVGD